MTHLPILAGIPLGSDLIFSRTLSTTIRDKASNSGLDSRLKYKKIDLMWKKKAEIDLYIYLSPQPDDLLSKFCSSRLTVKCWLIFSPVSAKQKVYLFFFVKLHPKYHVFSSNTTNKYLNFQHMIFINRMLLCLLIWIIYSFRQMLYVIVIWFGFEKSKWEKNAFC